MNIKTSFSEAKLRLIIFKAVHNGHFDELISNLGICPEIYFNSIYFIPIEQTVQTNQQMLDNKMLKLCWKERYYELGMAS